MKQSKLPQGWDHSSQLKNIVKLSSNNLHY